MGSIAPPDFVLSPCTLDDLDDLIRVYEAAFRNDYFSIYTFPPDRITKEAKHRWLRDRFIDKVAQPDLRHFKITDVSTGSMAAWVRWGYPHVFTEEEKAEKARQKEEKEQLKVEGKASDWPEGAIIEVCEAKFGALHESLEKNVDLGNMYGKLK